ncbi:metallophosphoesterase family protein [Shimia abyssi]|uniref:DNA repair exonuclease SbcCD nuclease subunit n=1 Tax=Shimia abyssi TaxID=1662395 RepID=A0A2P8F2Y3_9RHOB|nr:DNA repair exonuclease [Shimia abyssi]PSL16046.1 DNA repair exonuclease SbcCD nuclease subunit [Shimia abyssi]
MTEFTFVHTSDLHLGKGFGQMPDELRGRLIEARHEVLARLIQVARAHNAGHVLVAGDMFDSTGPSEGVRRQAATAMSASEDLQWWIIPGNHDSLQGEELWAAFDSESGDNVHVLREAATLEIEPDVYLLPAPLPRQFPGVDLTGWMADADTPEGALRIGLAHGGVVSFGEDFDSSALIPPDRAKTAQLDYLAMGDWHGYLPVGDRTYYCGSPERDRFKHNGRGACLVVTLAGNGATPKVESVETGRFDWRFADLPLNPGMDAGAELERLLPADRAVRRDVLVQLHATGFLRMAERGAFDEALQQAEPDFARLILQDEELATEYEVGDLDLIAVSGALRAAAEDLHNETQNTDLSAEDARVAQAALNRLWSLVKEG